MKKVLLSCLMLLFALGSQAQSDFQGEWKLSSMIYRGKPISLPNPNLNLRFTFYEDGMDRLYWDRGDTHEFCERWATYAIEDGLLKEEIIAVHPRNAVECEKDPDMKLGRKTETRIELIEGKVHLFFQLGEEELVYVLERSFVSCSKQGSEPKCLK